jgi:hypothetical protein
MLVRLTIFPLLQQVLKATNLVRNSNAEIQQRANEYIALLSQSNPAVVVSE